MTTLLVDHNADPVIASSRTFGDFVALATREGLQSMVDKGYAHMSGEIASGRLDSWLAQATDAARLQVGAGAAEAGGSDSRLIL